MFSTGTRKRETNNRGENSWKRNFRIIKNKYDLVITHVGADTGIQTKDAKLQRLYFPPKAVVVSKFLVFHKPS